MQGCTHVTHCALVPSSKYPAGQAQVGKDLATGLDVLQEEHTVSDVQFAQGWTQATH